MTDELRLAWPWQRPGGQPPPSPVRDSPDPALAARERAHGLTGDIARRWAALVPEILGPLRSDPAVRPLSLEGGHLRAVVLERLPLAPDGRRWLDDVELVVTDDVEVCRALADGRRRFLVRSPACVDAVARASAPELVEVMAPWQERDWLASPLEPGLLPLVRFGHRVWLCWDRDEERPTVVDARAQRGRRLGLSFGPVGPLPFAQHATPGAPPSHLAAGGDGWAAAWVADLEPGRYDELRSQVVTGHGRRWAILSHHDPRGVLFGELFAWRWRQDGRAAIHEDPERFGWQGTLLTVDLEATPDGGQRARVAWAGDMRAFVLRGGTLVALTTPHTLEQRYLQAGAPPHEIPRETRNLLTNALGPRMPGPETIEVALAADERIVAATASVFETLAVGELAALVTATPRRAASAIELRLAAAGGRGVVLVLDASATSANDGTSRPPLELTLRPEERPDEHPTDAAPDAPADVGPWKTWTIVRPTGRSTEAALSPERICPTESHEALARAVARLAFVPERGDILRVPGWHRSVHLQFDGTAWRVSDDANTLSWRQVAGGALLFAEDTPSPRLARALASAVGERPQDRITARQLERVAEEEGYPELAHYLRRLRAHRRGEIVEDLGDAAARVSPRVRERLLELDTGDEPATPHDVDVEDLRHRPQHYHRCRVRYRSVLSEGLERMFTAGGAWVPLDGPPPDRMWAAEVVATWHANPRFGYGHVGMQRTEARGRATPIVLPAAPRVVPCDELRWVRLGAPVRTELDIVRDRRLWTWRDQSVIPPLDEPEAPAGRYRMEVIVMRAEHLAVLRVLRSTPLPQG